MRRRLVRWLVITAVTATTLLVVLVAYASVRPINLAFAKPRIIDAVNVALPNYQVQINTLQLVWQPKRFVLTVEAGDIKLQPKQSGNALSVESAQLDISPLPLLVGRPRVARVTLDKPRLQLVWETPEPNKVDNPETEISLSAHELARFFMEKNNSSVRLPSIRVYNADALIKISQATAIKIRGVDVALDTGKDALIKAKMQLHLRPGQPPVKLEASTACAESSNDAARCDIKFAADHAQVADILSFWPENALPDVRTWIGANIVSGAATKARAHSTILLPPGRSPEISSLRGEFGCNDIIMRYIESGPLIKNLGADCGFDLEGFRASRGRGNLLGLDLRDIDVNIATDAQGEVMLRVATNFTGNATDAAALADAEPARLWRNIGTSANFASGKVSGTFVLGMPLRYDMSKVIPNFSLSTVLADLKTISPMWSTLALHAAELRLNLRQRDAKVRGNFALTDADTKASGTILVPESLNKPVVVDFSAEQFDLKNLAAFADSESQSSAPPAQPTNATISVGGAFFQVESTNIARATLNKQLVANNVAVSIKNLPTDGFALQVQGQLADPTKSLSLKLKGNAYVAQCDDVGLLVSSLGYDNLLKSGQLTLEGQYQYKAAQFFAGRFAVSNLDVFHFPLFARLLTASSITDLVNRLKSDQPVRFDKITFDANIGEKNIQINNGRATSSALGITLKQADISRPNQTIEASGVIMPLRALSKLVGSIPVAGKALVGKDGQGLLGVNFFVDGPLSDPNVRINAMSAIAPDAVQKIVK